MVAASATILNPVLAGMAAERPGPANTNRRTPADAGLPDPARLSAQLFQLVSTSLDGPKGIHPQSFIAAFGALAGRSARWIVRREIEAGLIADDFRTPSGVRRPGVTVSAHVDRHVHDLTGDSYAATLVPEMMAAGAGWLPHINAMIQHNFMAINAPAYPDYTVAEKHMPEIPPQALLIMLWENTLTCLRNAPEAETTAQKAFALATVKAAAMYEKKVPLAVSGQLALETAIAMSKLDYGF
ncbi:MAG: hypothetical protein JJ926_14645 [Roseitalea sp.]|jgi:hypothetical protein|nr:hypothetical protein [Oceaniradius stylonematis]MBO6554378.1 hypothetical protein [Roseitalea sp.]MBO6953461.1 hypothetical protein [Rhizobiaceae bacterium]RNC96906.1 MAG: hypothetical protein ED558_03385 [Oricola sp.]MBO6593770.1 hypothetical protein [Roseitalea sp.]MBO6601205.1 hypothetical protein [Roseitalea sp.]